jgi:hypothetical protein
MYIQNSFIFYQLSTNTIDCNKYCTLYHISPSNIPHIAIIDPRTKQKMWTHGTGQPTDKWEPKIFEKACKHMKYESGDIFLYVLVYNHFNCL